MNKDDFNFSDFIKTYRKNNNLSQEELASKLNVSGKTISSWETERHLTDWDTMQKVFRKLGYDFSIEKVDLKKENTEKDDRIARLENRIDSMVEENKKVTDGLEQKLDVLNENYQKVIKLYNNQSKRNGKNFRSVTIVSIVISIIFAAIFSVTILANKKVYLKYNDSVKIDCLVNMPRLNGYDDLYCYNYEKRVQYISTKFITVVGTSRKDKIMLVSFYETLSNRLIDFFIPNNEVESNMFTDVFYITPSETREYDMPDYIYYYYGDVDDLPEKISIDKFKEIKNKYQVWDKNLETGLG